MNFDELLELIAKLEEEDDRYQTPVEHQMKLLGIDELQIGCLAGKYTGLDIGCGNGALVNHMTSRGVNFEGIDEDAPDGKNFIKQNITDVYPHKGCIPRDNETYDLILAFQNNPLNIGFTHLGEIENPYKYGGSAEVKQLYDKIVLDSQFIIYEIVRTMKKRGRAVLYPHCHRIEENLGTFLGANGITINSEEVNMDHVHAYCSLRSSIQVTPELMTEAGMSRRTVLIK